MAGGMSHAEIEELLGAYALDAVEPEEAAEVEAHLGTCPRCASEVASHREVAAVLAHGGSAAPEGVWDRIASGLVEKPPAMDLSRVPLRNQRRRVSVAMVGVVAAAAAMTALLGVQVVRQDQRVDRLTSTMQRRALEQAAVSANIDTRAQRITLRSDDGTIYAHAAMQEDGAGYLVRHNLPPLPEDRSYQLWGTVGNRSVSIGLLGNRPGVVAFHVSGEVTTVAVTAEHVNGSVLPTGPPVVRGFLPDT
jgi:hypothetical protein